MQFALSHGSFLFGLSFFSSIPWNYLSILALCFIYFEQVYNLLSLVSIAYMYNHLGLITWDYFSGENKIVILEKTYSLSLPLPPSLFLSLQPLIVHSFASRGWVKISSVYISMSTAVVSCWSCLGDCILRFHGYSFPIIHRRHCFVAHIMVLWLLHSFHPLLLWYSLALRYRGCVVDLLIGVGHPIVICSLYFDKL